ncbi:type II secretion system F family protein [Arhodomonas aquaeolei]|uniref:type II secretion system F family protein n=1 Tax=Arhodomonas aquaeolei TaxID=2369 RepID=UPI000361466D|nr:type II secretion system F family protein [Arhodomonas aquaeolei]
MTALRTYYYRVLMPHGALRTGFYRIAVEQDFSARLRLEQEFDGTVVSLWPLPRPVTAACDGLRRMIHRGIRAEDLAGFLRDMGIMLRAGVPALDALRTIIGEGETTGTRGITRIARQMHDDLDAGVSVSEAFARRPDVFPETVRNLVAIGDQSGNLDRMLIEGAEHTERMVNIRRDVRTALIYPIFVFASIIAVAAFWITYVVPTMGDLFEQLNAEMPAITRNLIAFSDLVAGNALAVILVLAALIAGITWAVRNHEPTRHAMHTLAHRLPVTRVLATSSGMAAISEHLAILVRSGLDIVTSLDVLTRATGDLYYRRRLARVREAVTRGEGVASSMRAVGGFPAMAVRMIAVGEDSGSIDEQLDHLSAEYRKRLDVVIASLSEIIKPAIILVAGALFFVLVLALLIPIYDLIRQAMQISAGGV